MLLLKLINNFLTILAFADRKNMHIQSKNAVQSATILG